MDQAENIKVQKVNATMLGISVFACGAVVMVFELAGSRVMAPHFGTSIYVWTGIIGVILGSLSCGYWLGGRMADNKATARGYSLTIFLSGLAVFWSLATKDLVPPLFAGMQAPVELRSFLAALFLFAPASVILGIVSPYAVRLKLSALDRSASIVGNLYAVSTLGSIVGTFAAGYFLIPFFGTAGILFVLSLVLLLLSLCFTRRRMVLKIIAIAVVALLFWLLQSRRALYDKRAGFIRIDSEYNTISIYHEKHKPTGKPILSMTFDRASTQASMFADGDQELVWDYTKYYRLVGHFVPKVEKALMLGGGAYSYPKDFLRVYPEGKMDVVEIDPAVTAAARKYFKLKDDPRLTVRSEDARAFLNLCGEKYDVIFDDVFGASLNSPFHLATKEAVARRYELLNPGGTVMANVIGSIEGANGRLLRAVYTTYRSVFPQVYLMPVKNAEDGGRMQNVMLIAMKSETPAVWSSDNEELNGYLAHRWTDPIPEDMAVLTDDFAPVDYYMHYAF